MDTVYNVGMGKLLDDEYTMGQDWTFYDDAHNIDQRPDGGQVFAYVNCQVRDILVYWTIDPKFTPGCPVIVFQEPTTQIVSDANLDPVMVRYNGYACIDDYYWEWVEYNQIFPS